MTFLGICALRQQELFPAEQQPVRVKPFLKWAGGKTRLMSTLRRCIPAKPFLRYFEPFLGGGALFFDLAPHNASLSDSNAELIECYKVVRDEPKALIQELSSLHVSESEFYRIRSLRPQDLPRVARAARFIYLNKTCYNGLYRVNKRGEFNTPFGRYENVNLADKDNLLRASTLLKGATLACQSYESLLRVATKGDFIYLDPPYMPISRFSDFKRYTKEFFYESDHEKLATIFAGLTEKGCYVLLSNSCHKKIRALYAEFSQVTVEVPRFVNCKGAGRGNVQELLIANYPLQHLP